MTKTSLASSLLSLALLVAAVTETLPTIPKRFQEEASFGGPRGGAVFVSLPENGAARALVTSLNRGGRLLARSSRVLPREQNTTRDDERLSLSPFPLLFRPKQPSPPSKSDDPVPH